MDLPSFQKEMHHVLVVDDDDRLRDLLSQFLRENTFLVSASSGVGEAETVLSFFQIDLIVLDIMMPERDGLSFLCDFRHRYKTPVLLLSAKWEVDDRLLGFEKGADDYLAKPFDPRELLFRIQSLLKRVQPLTGGREICFGTFTYDRDKRSLKQEGMVIPLSTTEGSLLHIFVEHRGQKLSRETLMKLCEAPVSPRTIDVQIARLRKKLRNQQTNTSFIQTIRHQGYVFWGDV